MKRKTLARALAMALCLMLCVPAMATSWDWTAGSQTAAADAPASAQYAGDEALTGAVGRHRRLCGRPGRPVPDRL